MTGFDRSAFADKFVQEAREYLEVLNRDMVGLEKNRDSGDLLVEMLRAAHTLKGSSRMLKYMDVNQVSHCLEDALEDVRDGRVAMSAEVGDVLFLALDQIGSCVEGIARGSEGDRDVSAVCRSLESLRAVAEPVADPAPASAAVPVAAAEVADAGVPVPDRSAFAGTFVQEAREHLEVLNQGMVDLEQNPGDGDLLVRLLRAAHTLKGSSRMLTYMDINQVAHCMEVILEDVQDGRLAMSAEVGDVFFLGLDQIGGCIEGIASGRAGQQDVSAVCRSLGSLRAGEEPTAESARIAAAVPEAAEQGADAGAGDEDRVRLAVPPPEAGAQKPAGPEAEGKNVERPAKKKPATAEETIRIGTSSLDATIGLAGEIRVSGMRLDHHLNELAEMRRMFRVHLGGIERGLDGRNGHARELEQFCQGVKGLFGKIDDLYRKYREELAGLGRLAADLQGTTLDMRMLPLSTIFDSLPRAIRDLSRTVGKEIELSVAGADTRMDKKLIEKLDGPIVHMVRNCIDHGIEAPAERQKVGKPARGQLRLSASQEGDHIAIVVEDDGVGIDLEAVKRKALAKGLIDQEHLDRLPESEIANFIFLPGFSTAPIITDISGRGVGMDVVMSTVEQLKGTVSIQTEKGVGSRFVLRLPMTLTTTRAMLFQCAGLSFAIPVGYIAETVNIEQANIIQVVDREAISLNNQLIPIARLDRVLGLPDSTRQSARRFPVLVARSGREHVALIVDAIVDEQDILLKPIPRHMGKTPCVSGLSIFGDNQISVVLHVPGVADAMKRMTGSRPAEAKRTEGGVGRAILVVDDSLNTREIEKSILEASGYDVDMAQDGVEALRMVRNRRYDMIVTDLDMPRMDGFALVERLRAEADFAHIPIVIVTAREREEDKRRGIEVGADAYIPKGAFDQSMLIDTIASLIG
jgi:chemotaxis protein histidine kinase CheA/CheY-like chemotaxis protein